MMSANVRRGAALCLILTAAGCGLEKHNPWRSGDNSPSYLDVGWRLRQASPHTEQPQVDRAGDCNAVDTWVKERMSVEMEASLRNQLRNSLRYDHGPGIAVPMAQTSSVPEAKSDPGPGSYTGTNNQVAGIEEPDGLKSDGTYFYHIDGVRLRIARAWPVTDMQLLASLDLPGQPQSMLLTDSKKLVVFMKRVRENPGTVASLHDAKAGGFLPTFEDRTLVATIDVEAPQNPQLLGVITFEGSLLAARRVGDQVRMVFSRNLRVPEAVKPYMDGDFYDKSPNERLTLVEERIRFNRNQILNTSLDDLLSSKSSEQSTGLQTVDCQKMFLPRNSSSFGLTDITTLDVNSGEARSASLFASADGIHGAAGNLYLSTHHYWWDQDALDVNYLYVHKFSYDDAGQPQFRGSAGMEGNLLNQFSLDEFDGHLRVAASVMQRQDPDSWSMTTYNRVYVVKEYDGFLAVAGMTEPIAKDETIFGVRFDGPRGYVVTFRRVDPLFVIGFDDPVKPQILGELKIPGYSTYLHPIGDGLILAVGEDIDEVSQMSLGNKISVFDVTDPATPKERFKKVLSSGFYSESLYNHKSFKYHAASRTLAMPSSAYVQPSAGGSNYIHGISVFSIDPEKGITDRGVLSMAGRASDGSYWYSSTHAFIADDVVYGIDSHGIRAAKSAAPGGQTWDLSYH